MKISRPDFLIAVFFFIATVCIVFLGTQNLKQRETIKALMKSDRQGNQTFLLENERRYNYISLKENGAKISKGLILKDSLNVNFFEYINSIKHPLLVLRFSYLGCNACIDSALNKLKNYDRLQQNAIIWATYKNEVDLLKFKAVNRISLPVYILSEKDKILTADDERLPYMFMLKPGDNHLHDLFFPMKELPNRTEEYLEIIAEKYFIKS